MTVSLRSSRTRRASNAGLSRRTRTLLITLAVGALMLLPAPPIASGTAEAHGIWAWPVTGPPTVEKLFDPPEFFYSAGHRGLDVSGSSLTITAVDDGVVTFAGPVAGKPVVSIRHPNGLQSTYEPVRASVKAGDEVKRGQVIGQLDPAAGKFSHCAPRLCLHVGAKRSGSYIDPLPLFGAAVPSVLKPLGGISPSFGPGRSPGGADASPIGAQIAHAVLAPAQTGLR